MQVTWGWSLSQLILGEKRGTPWRCEIEAEPYAQFLVTECRVWERSKAGLRLQEFLNPNKIGVHHSHAENLFFNLQHAQI